jgi:Luciferase-like monooxygenase
MMARQFQDQPGFAVQVFPIDTPTDPAKQLLGAARLAEELGFDAFFVGDHPAWALDPFVHLAALAATTHRIRLGVNETGGRRFVNPRFRELAPEENDLVVMDYIRRLPRAARPLARWLGLDVRGSESERRAHSRQLLMVAFRPGGAAQDRFASAMSYRAATAECEREHQPDAHGTTQLGLAPYSRCFVWRHQ